jgi:uncharacterized protein (DUF2267 family)
MYENGFGLETIKDRFGKSSAAKLNAMKMHMELKSLYTASWVFTALCMNNNVNTNGSLPRGGKVNP